MDEPQFPLEFDDRYEVCVDDAVSEISKAESFDFSIALLALKGGLSVHRHGWINANEHVVLMSALQLPPFSTQDTARKVNDRTAKWIGPDTPLYSQAYFAKHYGVGLWQPGWLPNNEDLLANDWYVSPAHDI